MIFVLEIFYLSWMSHQAKIKRAIAPVLAKTGLNDIMRAFKDRRNPHEGGYLHKIWTPGSS
jgi:hypothetical protein